MTARGGHGLRKRDRNARACFLFVLIAASLALGYTSVSQLVDRDPEVGHRVFLDQVVALFFFSSFFLKKRILKYVYL